jgi:hypothetical protein
MMSNTLAAIRYPFLTGRHTFLERLRLCLFGGGLLPQLTAYSRQGICQPDQVVEIDGLAIDLSDAHALALDGNRCREVDNAFICRAEITAEIGRESIGKRAVPPSPARAQVDGPKPFRF